MAIRTVAAVFLCAAGSFAADLQPAMVRAFDRYTRDAESRIDERVRGERGFLWSDESAERLKSVQGGDIAVEPLAGNGDLETADALVHDWMGAVFVRGVTLPQTLASVQDYGRNKETHKPEVLDSKVLEHRDNEFRVFLRLMKKKVITVVLNTEHDIRYFPMDAARCHSRSYSTRISEVDNPGKPNERELPVGKDHGYLWRLNSYWRFEERDGGVYIECQAISLTRDVPMGLGWLIEPIIRTLPRESLVNTLVATRKAIETKYGERR
jgi:hypothetical protein